DWPGGTATVGGGFSALIKRRWGRSSRTPAGGKHGCTGGTAVSADVLGRLSGSRAQPRDHRVPVDPRDPASPAPGVVRPGSSRERGAPAVPARARAAGPAAQVPALVVRLQPSDHEARGEDLLLRVSAA